MKLEFCRVNIHGKKNPQKTFTKVVFKYYFENLRYTRNDFVNILNVNHRIFTVGLRAYYSNKDIEKLRVQKIVNGNIGNRIKTWDEKLKDIEKFSPGFIDLFKFNVKENPEIVINKLLEINDNFYKFKQALKPIKKYLNQSLDRLGKDRLNMVGNGLEAKVKFILDDLGLKYKCQFKVDKFIFDFKVNNTLIEVDGKQFHNISRDKPKSKCAKDFKFNLLRLTENDIKTNPQKIIKCLKKLQ